MKIMMIILNEMVTDFLKQKYYCLIRIKLKGNGVKHFTNIRNQKTFRTVSLKLTKIIFTEVKKAKLLFKGKSIAFIIFRKEDDIKIIEIYDQKNKSKINTKIQRKNRKPITKWLNNEICIILKIYRAKSQINKK